jgi:DNA polymerase (family 10)
MPTPAPTNARIAAMLDRIADLLAARDENPFRVRSYRNAAASVRAARLRIAQKARTQGAGALAGIPGVGEKLRGLITEFVTTGTVGLLSSLEKEVPDSAKAALDAEREKHPRARRPLLGVAAILGIDAEYRRRAAVGTLKRIAPRQFNPGRKAWLPLLATNKGGWKFTVMFSNTAAAHTLGTTDDWVVVYYEKGTGEQQCTVVTEKRGPLKGKRVVRGREAECKKYYA